MVRLGFFPTNPMPRRVSHLPQSELHQTWTLKVAVQTELHPLPRRKRKGKFHSTQKDSNRMPTESNLRSKVPSGALVNHGTFGAIRVLLSIVWSLVCRQTSPGCRQYHRQEYPCKKNLAKALQGRIVKATQDEQTCTKRRNELLLIKLKQSPSFPLLLLAHDKTWQEDPIT